MPSGLAEKLHSDQKHRISTEMYLKTIYELKTQKNSDPRPVDIVNCLEVSKGSVSEMLKKLSDEGFIKYKSYGVVELTNKGLNKAKNILEKYRIIRKFLSNMLKVNENKVHDEACNLEHAFSDESVLKLEKLIKSARKSTRIRK